MTNYIIKCCQRLGIGALFIFCGLFSQPIQGQCDFINNITGIVQTTLPVGDAANPALYTQVYVLVDNQGNIFATGPTPDFLLVPPGFYNLYAVNYINTEALAVLPLLVIGQPWFNVEVYGNDDVNNCLDYSPPYGSGCPIVVCDEISICEFDTLDNPAVNYNTTNHDQTYCLVCADQVVGIETTGEFPLVDYPQAIAGANCQIFGVNFNTLSGAPINVGDSWTTVMDLECANSCIDFIGRNLDITPITQLSGNGISTTVDWWNAPCLGAQASTNGGLPFLEVVNNWCVPSYNPSGINARPTAVQGDDLERLMGGEEVYSRFPCVGTMDLTQHTIFYTVECDPSAPSQLDVLVSNTDPTITGVQAALYGPVNAACPTLTGGTFVDCNDAGTNSSSGNPMGNITLTTNGNPGEVYIVIVDTEGTGQFTISSTVILLNTKLVAFTGIKQDEDNLLRWTVADEQNVDQYILERSDDGISFSSLTSLPALNNGAAVSNYNFTDVLPGIGARYYRLKIVNADASIEYSNVVVLSRGDEDLGGVAIFPNPTKGIFYAEFASSVKTSIDYEIKDIIGQTVQEGSADVDKGLNKIELSLEGFPSATYVVSLTMSGQRVQRKLIKQ